MATKSSTNYKIYQTTKQQYNALDNSIKNNSSNAFIIAPSDIVDLTTNQTISGEKIFNTKPLIASALPSGYQEIEYIQSNGSSYYATNIDVRTDQDYITVDMWQYTNNAANKWMFGTPTPIFAINSHTNNNIEYHAGNGWVQVVKASAYTRKSRYQFGPNGFYFDGEKVADMVTSSTTNKLFIFSRTAATSALQSGTRFYHCTIERNGSITHDLIPCKRTSDSAIGIYDTKTSTFISATGTTASTMAGPNITSTSVTVGSDLATVATSGSYNDLLNKPTISDFGGLSNPMTTAGDIIYGGSSGTPTRLAKGTAGQVLTMNSGATAPTWTTPNMSATDASFLWDNNNNNFAQTITSTQFASIKDLSYIKVQCGNTSQSENLYFIQQYHQTFSSTEQVSFVSESMGSVIYSITITKIGSSNNVNVNSISFNLNLSHLYKHTIVLELTCNSGNLSGFYVNFKFDILDNLTHDLFCEEYGNGEDVTLNALIFNYFTSNTEYVLGKVTGVPAYLGPQGVGCMYIISDILYISFIHHNQYSGNDADNDATTNLSSSTGIVAININSIFNNWSNTLTTTTIQLT